MKLGTQLRLPDGREGTVVFNSLIGEGIKWGLHDPDPADFEGTDGNTVSSDLPYQDWPWEPEALLRNPSEKTPGLFEKYGFKDSDCVGTEFEILREGLSD